MPNTINKLIANNAKFRQENIIYTKLIQNQHYFPSTLQHTHLRHSSQTHTIHNLRKHQYTDSITLGLDSKLTCNTLTTRQQNHSKNYNYHCPIPLIYQERQIQREFTLNIQSLDLYQNTTPLSPIASTTNMPSHPH